MTFADDVVLGRRLQGVNAVFRSVAEETKMNGLEIKEKSFI
jgi:hypothetical protein